MYNWYRFWKFTFKHTKKNIIYIYIYIYIYIIPFPLPVEVLWSSNCYKTVSIRQCREHTNFIIPFEMYSNCHFDIFSAGYWIIFKTDCIFNNNTWALVAQYTVLNIVTYPDIFCIFHLKTNKKITEVYWNSIITMIHIPDRKYFLEVWFP